MTPKKLAKLYCKNHNYNYNQVRRHFLILINSGYAVSLYSNQFITEFWSEVKLLIPS